MKNENETYEAKTDDGIYAGVDRSGKNHVLIIAGTDWSWPRTKFTNQRFNDCPVGLRFTLKSTLTIDSQTERPKNLEVEWESLEYGSIHELCEETQAKYTLQNNAGKRLKSIKSAQKKLNSKSIRNMTLQQIRDQMSYLNSTQKAAMIAVIIGEVA